ncbi:hypothetical protein HOY82DRAFT_648006 [Tuber indicum]|nr:hypothetical protein HOY82DRAFT_648006 [Tuber indicum]
MARISATTIRAAKAPKHIINIGMSPDEYFELKIHIKSIVVPGTPGFEGKRSRNKVEYRRWLGQALEEIGPKFFPGGGKRLVWPVDYDRIYGAVDQVIQALGYKIRRDHKKVEGLEVDKGEKNDEMGMVENGEHCEGGLDDTNIDEDAFMIDPEFAQEKKQVMEISAMGQNDVDGEAAGAKMEPEMEPGPTELEDLFDLLRPEVFAEFPDLADEHFDWAGITDSQRPEPNVRLLLLIA